MNQAVSTQHYDPNRFIDILMKKLGLSSDKALSKKLNIAKDVIHKIRAGFIPVAASTLLWIAEVTGISIHELRNALGDRRAKFRVNCALIIARAG
ncbi:helix-turn-helix domain-containing protein [Noviherbaspirillum sp.]|uniref:helix-turn-helix domain-containing protein n=1 Tax=Noviherbaspirillum sp. TaxID=1926288 RepID=UPI002FDFECD6